MKARQMVLLRKQFQNHPGYAVSILLLAAAPALADVGSTFGLGSRNASLGGATAAGAFDAFSAYTNPAGLPFAAGEKRLGLSYGIIAMEPSFRPIQGVITTNDYTSDAVRTGDVDLDYRATAGQVFGLSYRLEGERRVSLGLAAFLPLNQLAFIDTGEPFVPEYFLYRARTQRPQMEVGLGLDLGKGLSAGAGIHVGFGMTTNASVLLEPGSTNPSPSTMRFSASVKAKAAPTFGFLFSSTGDPAIGWNAGLVGRLPLASRHEMVLNAAANVITPLDFTFNGASALAYDPASVEIGFSLPASASVRVFAQADYQLWKNFEAPAIVITDIPGQGMVVSPSRNPAFNYRNILIGKLATEMDLGSTVVRFSYGYRPGVLKDPPSEAGNYLDPSKHMIQAGTGFRFQRFLHFQTPWRLDLHLAYHHLISQHVTKSPGNETGDPIEEKIGAPGYDTGGKIYGGGISLSMSL